VVSTNIIRVPWARMNTPAPTPVRQLFSCTTDTPWPLYQGLGEEGFMMLLKGRRSAKSHGGGWGGVIVLTNNASVDIESFSSLSGSQ